MEFWAETLKGALALAISVRRAKERAEGFTSDSIDVINWQKLYDEIDEKKISYIYLKESRN